MFTLWVNDVQQSGSYRHMATARQEAQSLAFLTSSAVEVCTEGHRVRTIIHPDGKAAAPDGMVTPPREDCKRDSGQACFCTACREERKATRKEAIQ